MILHKVLIKFLVAQKPVNVEPMQHNQHIPNVHKSAMVVVPVLAVLLRPLIVPQNVLDHENLHLGVDLALRVQGF